MKFDEKNKYLVTGGKDENGKKLPDFKDYPKTMVWFELERREFLKKNRK